MRKSEAEQLYAYAMPWGFLIGFGFVFIYFLKSFTFGETTLFTLFFQVILSSIAGLFSMFLGILLVMPIVQLITLFGDPD